MEGAREGVNHLSESRFNDSKFQAIQVLIQVVESDLESPLNHHPESPLNRLL